VERSRRRERLCEAGKEIIAGLLEPFVLEDLYPAIEKEIEPGVFHRYKHIQSHQRVIHAHKSLNGSTPKMALINGGFGSGKTITLCAHMVMLARTHPGIKICVISAYDYFFDEFIMPTWWEVIPEDSRHIKSYNAKSRTLRFVNGSIVRFKAYDNADKVKGWQAHVIWIEEASELGDGNNEKALQIWTALMGRLRASRPRYPLHVYVSQNPAGHNWTWKLFIKNEPTAPQPLGDVGKDTPFRDRNGEFLYDEDGKLRYYTEWEKIKPNGDVYYTISTGTNANAHLGKGYVSSLRSTMADSPGDLARLVEGKFTPLQTLVYDAPLYSERTHVIPYQAFLDYWEIPQIPSWWEVIVGIDTAGHRSPWAVEYYVKTEDDHWICFDEIYITGPTWGEISDMILEKSAPYENLRYAIDPIHSNQRHGPTAETIAKEFARRGLNCEMPRGYSVGGGVMHVKSFLRRDQSRRCPYLVDTRIDDGQNPEVEKWEIGHANLYYLTGVPWRQGEIANPKAHAAPSNLAEKAVYRHDTKNEREGGEAEEGLTPVLEEKIVGRDDHAQTAEFFAFMMRFPKETRSAKRRRQPLQEDKPQTMYAKSARARRGF
jgi:hypothetical protein